MHNILWISHFLPYPPKGGGRQRSYGLLTSLKDDHNIHLIAINTTLSDTVAAQTELSKICNKVTIINLHRNSLHKLFLAIKSLISFKSYTMTWLKNIGIKRDVKRIYQNYNYDLVHIDSIDVAYLRPFFTKSLCVLNHHNFESKMMQRRSEKEHNVFKKFYFYLESKKLRKDEIKYCSQFNENIVVSNDDGIEMLNNIKDINITVIPNGVDLSYFNPPEKIFKNDNKLIFAGGLSWYPNRDAMLHFVNDILPEIDKADIKIRMDIVGANPPQKLINMAKSYPNVNVLGFVDDVRVYMNSASVYVCPIRDGGGTKLKVIDALAMKIPLVAYPQSVEGLELKNRKHFLLAHDVKEFVLHIKELLQNKELRKQLSENGRKLVEEKYSFAAIGKDLSNIYNKILD